MNELRPTAWHERPVASSAAGRFWEGWAAAWHGWRLLWNNPPLWWPALVPTLVNLVISALIAAVTIGLGYWAVSSLHESFAGQLSGWGWYAAIVAEAVLVLLLAVVLLIVAAILWKLATTVICGHFFARLAERVERLLGVQPNELRPVGSSAEAIGLLLSLVVLVVGSLVLTALVFIPVAGGILAFVVGTLFTFWIMGLDYLGYPLALRGIPRWRQYPRGWRQSGHVLGLGAFVSLCELVPILGAVPLTAAVVGAVLLHRKVEAGTAAARLPAE